MRSASSCIDTPMAARRAARGRPHHETWLQPGVAGWQLRRQGGSAPARLPLPACLHGSGSDFAEPLHLAFRSRPSRQNALLRSARDHLWLTKGPVYFHDPSIILPAGAPLPADTSAIPPAVLDGMLTGCWDFPNVNTQPCREDRQSSLPIPRRHRERMVLGASRPEILSSTRSQGRFNRCCRELHMGDGSSASIGILAIAHLPGTGGWGCDGQNKMAPP